MRPFSKIALLGYGSIAHYVAKALQHDSDICITQVLCKAGREDEARRRLGNDIAYITSVEELAPDLDIVVECAGQQALRDYGCSIIALGHNLLVVSTGAFANDEFREQMSRLAARAGTFISITSGAIGALDAIAAAAVDDIDEVVYTGRKPPQGWRGSPAEQLIDLTNIDEPTQLFSGCAREAALLYPKNANVAATIALAGVGFDRTRVSLFADPTINTNQHTVRVSGSFGGFEFNICGSALPDNPRSSALSAMSVIARLKGMSSSIRI